MCIYMFLCVNIIEEAEGGSEQQDMLTKQRNWMGEILGMENR